MASTFLQRNAPTFAAALNRLTRSLVDRFRRRWSRCAWCAIAYAVPAALLAAWAYGQPDGPMILIDIYGFPSTFLLRPVAGLLELFGWRDQVSLFFLMAALGNGTIVYWACRAGRKLFKKRDPRS